MTSRVETAETPLPDAASPAGRTRRLSLLAALYVSQAIPLGFFIEALPAIGRDLGLSLRDVGLIQVLAAPFMLKFLWAPLVDGAGSARFGHYRSWLVPLQLGAVVTVVAIAAVDPAAAGAGALLPLAGLFLLLAATQDIASDGLAVRVLTVGERGVGNGIQVGGFYLGQILGGGVMLLLFARFGWSATLLTMAAMLAVPLTSLAGFREGAPVERRPRVDFRSLPRFFRRARIGGWVAILLVYRAPEAMALTMAKPMFVDLGLTLTQIGWIAGLGNSLAALSGALAGGAWVGRLGRKRALVTFAALHAAALLGYLAPAAGSTSLPVLWAVSALGAFTGGMATAALYTHMMDRAHTASAGTDFTLQQSLAVVGPLAGAGVSGFIAGALGYGPHFAICAALALGVAGLVGLALRVDTTRA